jgi:hypothetical protein
MTMKKDSTSFKVVVGFHAGYKGNEKPRKITMDGEELAVEHVLERRRIRDHKTGQLHEEFTCVVNKRLAKLSIYPEGQHYLTFLKS